MKSLKFDFLKKKVYEKKKFVLQIFHNQIHFKYRTAKFFE